MQLNEKHYKCIELILEGLKYTDISKKVPCSRTAIYDWLGDADFKDELDNQRQEIKTQANNKILAKVDNYRSKIEELAENATSETVRLNALEFLFEVVNGKASQKVDQTIQDKRTISDNVLDLDSKVSKLPIDKSIEDKIIDINRAK